MKLVNYKLQTQIEYLNDFKSTNYFKEYLQSILKDRNKSHFQKCDYIGLSLQSIKSKIDSLTNDIQELQILKKNLSSALDIAKSITAQIFIENGIDRIDGNIISSITLSNEVSKTKENLIIKDENKIMGLGYVKFSIDEDAILKALKTKQGKAELNNLVELTSDITTTPAKVKVNSKKAITLSSSDVAVDEIIENVA